MSGDVLESFVWRRSTQLHEEGQGAAMKRVQSERELEAALFRVGEAAKAFQRAPTKETGRELRLAVERLATAEERWDASHEYETLCPGGLP